jgi:hypothetical protein
MTEDDTFNRLKRPPFQEMWGPFVDFLHNAIYPKPTDEEISIWLKEHGWTIRDFYLAYHSTFQ